MASEDSPKVSEAASAFMKERGVRWAPKTRQFYAAAVRLLVEFLGNPPVASVTRRQAAVVKDNLVKLPANYTKLWPGKSAPEVLGMGTVVSSKTVNHYLDAMSATFRWAVRQGYMTANVFEGLSVPLPRTAQEERDAFTTDELRLILNAPVYTGCVSARRRHDPGPAVLRDSKYWVPLVGLFSGLRLEEVCQLRVKDVLEVPDDDGGSVWCFRVTAEAGRVKTPAAQRLVPVHPALVNAGLLDYHEKVKRQGHSRLWPDIQVGADGYFSSAFSKWFGRFKERAGVTNSKATFHSFRHNVADAFKRAGVRQEVRDALLGHTSGKINRDRYGSPMPVGVLLEEGVRKITYRGLRLGHLNRRSRPTAAA